MLVFTIHAVKKSYYNAKCKNKKKPSPGCTYVLFRILDIKCASVIDWQQCLQGCVPIFTASANIFNNKRY